MTWVGWRQQRTETLLAVGMLALLAAVFVPTGLAMSSAYHHDGLSGCLGQNTSFSCGAALRSFTGRFHAIGNMLSWLTLLPGLVGVLLAAPFVLPLEDGTYGLDWTQSITRGRWIAGKLTLAIVTALLLSLAYIAMVTWWRTPLVHLQGRMDNSVFDSEGVVVCGYTLFALGLALAVGVIWRRAVAAFVVAFGGYFAARVFVDGWLRQRLTPPKSLTWAASKPEPASLFHASVFSQSPSDRLGHVVAVNVAACPRTNELSYFSCLTKHGGAYIHAVYEPANRFWSMQVVEFALFAGLALTLIALAAWWAHARTE